MLNINKIYKSSRKDASINIRVPEELYNKYKKLSLETNYPFNGLILYAINFALDDKEKKKYKTSKTDISTNLRIPNEIHNEYKNLSNKYSRSINSLVVSAMYYFIQIKSKTK